MSEPCIFCGGPVNPHDQSAWKEVKGLVGGPKKDSMRLREDTGRYAHGPCVKKAMAGQAPDQEDLFNPVVPIVYGYCQNCNRPYGECENRLIRDGRPCCKKCVHLKEQLV